MTALASNFASHQVTAAGDFFIARGENYDNPARSLTGDAYPRLARKIRNPIQVTNNVTASTSSNGCFRGGTIGGSSSCGVAEVGAAGGCAF